MLPYIAYNLCCLAIYLEPVLLKNGELNTVEEVIQAILDIGGQELTQVGAPITFTARIAHKLLQRSDPLGLMIRNYEERQDDMMKDQRKIFRNEMAHLHRKTLERVGIDTKAMVQVMRETLDKSEKELATLKAENKSLILKHTLLSTEHAVMKAKYPMGMNLKIPWPNAKKNLWIGKTDIPPKRMKLKC